jgi:hypothetical protein
MTMYTVPDNPADPEAAALELIVRMPTSGPTARHELHQRRSFPELRHMLCSAA